MGFWVTVSLETFEQKSPKGLKSFFCGCSGAGNAKNMVVKSRGGWASLHCTAGTEDQCQTRLMHLASVSIIILERCGCLS